MTQRVVLRSVTFLQTHSPLGMKKWRIEVPTMPAKTKAVKRGENKQWMATFKVTHTTHVTVEAATEEEARVKFAGCDWADERADGVVDHAFDGHTKIEDAS